MQSQIESFEKAVRTGQDLIRYMSRNVLDVDFEDKMFSDWRFLVSVKRLNTDLL
jgi:hypothetical protein